MYLVKTPNFIKNHFPQITWNISAGDKSLYLTFDDGPHPEITPQVLEILDAYEARATFFCLGKNVLQYPKIVDRIRAKNHSVGSHTFHHLNGWRTDNATYLQDVFRAAELIGSPLFRPPYGRIKPSQIKSISEKLQIVMWSILSGDFDQNISPKNCLSNILRHTKDGDIVVLHDSEKAAKRMLYVLPRLLDHFSREGFSFHPITYDIPKQDTKDPTSNYFRHPSS